MTLQTKQIYRGPEAPLTSLALLADCSTLFAGCWDKTIWSWDVCTRETRHRYHGHSDFVKSVKCANIATPTALDTAFTRILISGSADATIIVWNVGTGEKLAVARNTGRILDMAIDMSTSEYSNSLSKLSYGEFKAGTSASQPSAFTIYTASSDPQIRRWRIEAAPLGPSPAAVIRELEVPEELVHETSVNALCLTPHMHAFPDSVPENPENLHDEKSILYTASSDNTMRSFIAAPKQVTGGDGDESTHWSPDLSLTHPDFVRGVVVDQSTGLIITACRDEDVRVYDANDGGRLVHIWRGHFEEVTGLTLLGDGENGRTRVVSVSIDCTVRTWSLEREEMEKARQRENETGEIEGMEDAKGKEATSVVMTEEEEKELAELMDDTD